jgi:hypothetical protein
MKRFPAPAFVALAIVLCPAAAARSESGVPAAGNWRDVATSADRKRLHDWRDAWVGALAEAGPGHAAEIAAEGVLLDPDAALAGAQPPRGDYRCRTIKLGSRSSGLLDYIAYPPFACRIGPGDAAGTMSLVKLTGSQRPIGRLFPESVRRMIFLGTIQLGDEKGVLRYGHDKERDMAGLVERIGDRRWRLVLPFPAFESLVDVIELVPAS